MKQGLKQKAVRHRLVLNLPLYAAGTITHATNAMATLPSAFEITNGHALLPRLGAMSWPKANAAIIMAKPESAAARPACSGKSPTAPA